MGVCVCVCVCMCVCLLSLFIHPGEMRRKLYYTWSQGTPKWLQTMFDKCMEEELSSDFPAGCKNELEIESSTKNRNMSEPVRVNSRVYKLFLSINLQECTIQCSPKT